MVVIIVMLTNMAKGIRLEGDISLDKKLQIIDKNIIFIGHLLDENMLM